MNENDPLIGKQIDNYKIKSWLGKGGMATVYLAEDTRLQRTVVIKMMLPIVAQDETLRHRFLREAQATAQLQHRNIVPIYSTGTTAEGAPYLALQYIEGGSLSEHLKRLSEQNQWISTLEALSIVYQIANALTVAHQAQIVHRDLKPSNILRREDGSVVVSDLGLAAIQQATMQLTQTGDIMGTPNYMSPEQAKGERLDGRSDIYSLGIILYELLAGRLPFDAGSPIVMLHHHIYEPPIPLPQLRPGLSDWSYHIVDACLQKEAANRYQTANQLVDTLTQAIAAEQQNPQAAHLSWPAAQIAQNPATAPTPHAAHTPQTPDAVQAAYTPFSSAPTPATPPAAPPKRPFWVYPLIALGIIAIGVIGYFVWQQTQAPPIVANLPTATVAVTEPVFGSETAVVPTSTEPAPTEILPTETTIPPTETAAPTATVTTAPTTIPPTATPNLLTLPIPADTPPTGRIVYTCYIDNVDDICSINADGSDERRLTNHGATDFYASYAPDGSQILFSSQQPGGFKLYAMLPDGSNQQSIGPSGVGNIFAPALSPNGQQIAFTAAVGSIQHIWLMNRDGTGLTQLTRDGSNNLDPTWSPDGSQIAFASDRDNESGFVHYVINVDGTGLRRLAASVPSTGGRNAWSADGQWLTFYAGPSRDRDIYLTAVNGNTTYQLTDGGSNLAPSFSPDGNWIAFTSYRDGDAEIFIMRIDGSDVRQLTFNGYADWQPRWGP